jgi:hypothetical protein
MFEVHVAKRAFSRAWANTGNRIAARIAIIAITTSSSMSVNASRLILTSSYKVFRLLVRYFSKTIDFLSRRRRTLPKKCIWIQQVIWGPLHRRYLFVTTRRASQAGSFCDSMFLQSLQEDGLVTLRLEDYLDAVFLDIETTGINPAYSELTLIALYQEDDTGKKARLYVNDLHDAAETLRHIERKAQEYGYDTITVCPLEQFAAARGVPLSHRDL